MHDAFVEALVQEVHKLRLGDGLDPATTQGPLITAAAVDRVSCSVGSAHCLGRSLLSIFPVPSVMRLVHWDHLALPRCSGASCTDCALKAFLWLSAGGRAGARCGGAGGTCSRRRAGGLGAHVTAGSAAGWPLLPAYGADRWVVVVVAE